MKLVKLFAPLFIAASVFGAVPAASQQLLDMTQEEMQQFIAQNPGATPEELVQMLNAQRDAQLNAQRSQAGAGYSSAQPPVLLHETKTVDTSRSSQPPVPLRLGQGVITAVSFVNDDLDAWPVRNVIYDRNLFSVNGSGCGDEGSSRAEGGNILNIFPCRYWVSGANINVTLEGYSRPIVFNVSAGSDPGEAPRVDSQITMKITDRTDEQFVGPASRRLAINPLDGRNGGVVQIYPAKDLITDVSFVDHSGNVWPIETVVFNPRLVSVGGSACVGEGQQGSQASEASGNVMYLSLCRNQRSNIAVKLQGAPAALALLLVPPTDESRATLSKPDSTITVAITGRSPNAPTQPATVASGGAMPDNNTDATGFRPDRYLTDFVNGTPPRGARPVIMTGAPNIEGYIYNGALYVRGSYTPVNPTADASAQSSSGTLNVWRYDRPTTSLLVADNQTGLEFSVTADF